VRAFVDFLVERLNFDVDYMQAMCPDRVRFEKAVNMATGDKLASELARMAAKAKQESDDVPDADADALIVTTRR
jgi:hypothetical protein